MRDFSNLLAYLTPGTTSEVLTAALQLTGERGAKLTLLDVVSDKPTRLAQVLALPAPGDHFDRRLAQRRSEMDARVQNWREEGFDVEGSVRAGTPAVEIVRAALHGDHDLVVLGPDPKRGFYGGTTLRVLRNAPSPVWMVRPGSHTRPSRVLAAVDPIVGQHQLNRSILEYAASISLAAKAELHVLHVWNTAQIPSPSSARVWYDWHEAARSELRERIERLVLPYEEHWHLKVRIEEGEPAATVVGFTRENGIDLAVMGTVNRSGVAGFLIGNTAEEILREIESSVLVVKSDDFVSPIAPRDPRAPSP